MTRFFVLLSLSALLFQVLPAVAVPPARTKVKSFAEWCQQKNTVPDKTRKTIDLLLKKVGTEDCQVANTKLNILSTLSFEKGEICDLQVLSGLTNLSDLMIFGNNDIHDLKLLPTLKRLKTFRIFDNSISDLKPLAGLTNLTEFWISGTQVSNLKPLAGLINLTYLGLNYNQISDLKSLTGLINLTNLRLEGNQISDLKPLAGLTKLKYLSLENNQISDLKSLAGLNNLTSLTILPQTAPVKANTRPAPEKLVRTLEVPSRIYMTALGRDRQTLVTAEDGSITVWNLATGASHSHTLLDREYATITALAISPDGRTLITASSGLDIQESSSGGGCSGLSCDWSRSSSNTKSKFGYAIQFWEINTGKGIGMLKLSTEEQMNFLQQATVIHQLEFSTNGKILSTQDGKGKILAWEYPTGERKPEADMVYPSAKPNSVVSISHNGKTSKIEIFAID